jgi:hypothetical protein
VALSCGRHRIICFFRRDPSGPCVLIFASNEKKNGCPSFALNTPFAQKSDGCPKKRLYARYAPGDNLTMQFGDHLGIAGLIVGLTGTGITILWPAKRWIGIVFLVVAFCLVLCWGYLAYSDRHPRGSSAKDEPQPSQTPASIISDVKPHLSAELVIDSDTPDTTRLHLNITNGPVAIASVRRASIATGGKGQFDGNVIYATEVAPRDKLEIDGPLIFYRKPETAIWFVVTYFATIDGERGTYYSKFKYVIPPIPNKFSPIIPTDTDEGAGDGGYEDMLYRSMPATLSGSIGSLALTVEEKGRDGAPGKFTLYSSNGVVLFNPITRKAAFIVGPKEDRRIVEQSFGPTENGIHAIVVSWDNSKHFALLSVDGHGNQRAKRQR